MIKKIKEAFLLAVECLEDTPLLIKIAFFVPEFLVCYAMINLYESICEIEEVMDMIIENVYLCEPDIIAEYYYK